MYIAPIAPIDTTECCTPSFINRSAASRIALMVLSSIPSVASISRRLGLIRKGWAPFAASSSSFPSVSRIHFLPFRAVIRSLYVPSGQPGGRLPVNTIISLSAVACSASSVNFPIISAVRGVPGSFSSVTPWPSRLYTFMLVLTCPGTVRK